MKSISLGAACLILYVVFNQNHVQASCKPGTYPSKHMVGSIQCVGCPKKCEHESHGDIDACKKACEKEPSTPSTPVTQSTSPIRTSRVNTSPPSSPDKRTPSTSPIRTSRVNTSPPSSPNEERNRKNKTTETVVAEVSGLTDADRLAIIIGVLASFIFFLIVAVFLIWKNSKSLSVDVKVDEEEAREMCSNSESSDYPSDSTTNDKRLKSDEESESASECPSEADSDNGSVEIVATTNGVPSNDYPSSELCSHESETYF